MYCRADIRKLIRSNWLLHAWNAILTVENNRGAVEKFRDAIVDVIPQMAEAVHNLEHERIAELLNNIFVYLSKNTNEIHYQLEKILTGLPYHANADYNRDKVEWALVQVGRFANGFAKKWVIINAEQMPFAEIILLVRVACFLECQDQMK